MVLSRIILAKTFVLYLILIEIFSLVPIGFRCPRQVLRYISSVLLYFALCHTI